MTLPSAADRRDGSSRAGDLHSRWVANHLLELSGEAEEGSLWNPDVLPPTVPALVRQAFTVGSPPVLTLWEPQREVRGFADSCVVWGRNPHGCAGSLRPYRADSPVQVGVAAGTLLRSEIMIDV
ncbi:hypothetical protein Aca07nite_64020 [Actinoplanes capillaceus]|uniref:Uncharacterized protein n=1 Tax=Actinoplanes campanulatus TaxID=113559 RepID=A0ABQ3WSD4_9ACTN|nr:hypothetical protein Aca07nite_64020 [Actinoplanes capillaceus]